MKFKLGKSLQSYYLLVFILMLTATGGGIYLYYISGMSDVGNISSIFEASNKIDEIKGKYNAGVIRNLVNSSKTREAVAVAEKLAEYSRKVDSIKHLDPQYQKLKSSSDKVKESLSGLLSFPELSSIFQVFQGKMKSFEKFVVSNNWRTLTRMSKRIMAQILSINRRTGEFFTYSQIKVFKRTVLRDLNAMKNITQNSVLDDQNKKVIVLKLEALKFELMMLDKYLKQLLQFDKDMDALTNSYKAWVKTIAPEISLKKIQFERNSNIMTFSLLAFFAFLLLSLLTGIMVAGHAGRNNKKRIEDIIIESIKDGIIPQNGEIDLDLSPDFTKRFDSLKTHIHKRMSLGTIFQDAIPFASVLLDSHLNAIWANQMFYECWDMRERKNKGESISWDYLQRFTNLGEEDPVFTALKDNVAGIYQIQLRTRQNKSTPFEMYVSPVKYGDQKRVMIFLYPLCFLEETIASQTKSLVGPVSRTLDSLNSSLFSEEFREDIKNDFDIAGINDLYNKFCKYYDFVCQQKIELMKEVESLENDLYDQYKLVDDLNLILNENMELQMHVQAGIQAAKQFVISIVDLRTDLEESYMNTASTCKGFFRDELELLNHADHMRGLLEENVKAIKYITNIRENVKDSKSRIDDEKCEIVQALNQAMVFEKISDHDNPELSHALGKIKMEIKGFESVLTEFTQLVTSLDVGLSKVDMILEKQVTPDLSELKRRFDNSREILDQNLSKANKIIKQGQDGDEEIIDSLKKLHETFAAGKEKNEAMARLINENKRSYDYCVPKEARDPVGPVPSADVVM